MPGPALRSRAGRLLVGAGLLFLATSAWCETLPVTRFTTREGLAGDRIKRIVADPSGFLWFCTASGLSRYDGQSFTGYGVADGLPDLSVNDLLVDADGSYWVATNGGGVASFRPRSTGGPLFVPVPILDPAPPSQRVNALHQSAGGRIWAGTDAGLFSWHPGKGETALRRAPLATGAESDAGTPVWSFAEDRQGRLWVGTSRGLWAIGTDGARTHYRVGSSAAHDVVGTVIVDRRQRVWAGYEDGLIVMVPGPGGESGDPEASLAATAPACVPPEPGGDGTASLPRAPGATCRWQPPAAHDLAWVRRLFEDGEGRLWVGSDAGLFSFEDERVTSYLEALPFPSRSLMALGEDAGDNLWVGTGYHGAARLVLDGFVTYGEADGLEDPFATSVFGGPEGGLYIVTRSRWVHRLEGDRLVSVRANLPDLGPEGGRVETHFAALDGYGDWWFPTRRGLFRFPAVAAFEDLGWRRPLGPYTTRDGLAGDGSRHAFADSRGDVWVTTRFPGREVLSRWERSTGAFHRYSDRDGLPPFNPAMSFLEQPVGTLWIGFWEGGLARYRDRRFELFGASEGLPEGSVTALVADSAGGLWVGAHGGVGHIAEPSAARPRFVRVAGADRLPQVTALVADLQKRLYIGTTRGLFRLDPGSERLERFTVAEGLAADWVHTAFRDGVGDLWFGTPSGLSRLSPRPARSRPPPVPRIEGFTVDGVRWPLPELGTAAAGPFDLPRRPARIRIDFAALAFHPGEVLRYRYRLEGAERGWEPAGEERSVLLGNLGPGRYRFVVEAIDRQEGVSPEPAAVGFTVPAPIWRRGWFVVLTVGVLTATLAGAHRLRVRRLLELERVRDRIAADLHDELGASLTRISILSEVARRGTDGGTGAILEEVGQTARSLLESTRDLVWAIDPRHEDAGELAVRLRSFASDLLDGRGIGWRLTTAGPLAGTALTPEQRRHLLLFFKEAIHNAVRHAGASRIELSLAVVDRTLRGTVEDDGCGIDPAALEAEPAAVTGGRGLTNLRQRATALGGRMEIDSTPGAGTRVRLEVPLR